MKNLLKNVFDFQKWGKNKQTAAYNGVPMVYNHVLFIAYSIL